LSLWHPSFPKPFSDLVPTTDAEEKRLDWAEEAENEESIGTNVDGASTQQMGSELLEPEFDVNVTLVNIQSDPNDPLFSIKQFDDLNL